MSINLGWLRNSKTQEVFLFTSPLAAKKNFNQKLIAGRELSPWNIIAWTRCGDSEEPGEERWLKFLSVSHCLFGPTNIYLPNFCSSTSTSVAFPPFWRTKSLHSTSSFVLADGDN